MHGQIDYSLQLLEMGKLIEKLKMLKPTISEGDNSDLDLKTVYINIWDPRSCKDLQAISRQETPAATFSHTQSGLASYYTHI